MRRYISGSAGAAAAGLVAAVQIWGAAPNSPVSEVSLTDASKSMCGANVVCPGAPAPDGGDQASAEQRIIDGYIAKQVGCTPDLSPNPQSITWDPPGFTPNAGGSGEVNDADPRLGGHFLADYVNGRWHIDYMYC
ncbi:integrase [Mycobacterium decipiens]|uniref:Integrase n=1 Tax=Mycobacterium decipiens TaxID=1430326 RepID=A0A1X2LY33_9MYCO|nr:integrase [Mycobacterium decipiens]OSC42128.1 integrase [Mycobacterium decipiens]